MEKRLTAIKKAQSRARACTEMPQEPALASVLWCTYRESDDPSLRQCWSQRSLAHEVVEKFRTATLVGKMADTGVVSLQALAEASQRQKEFIFTSPRSGSKFQNLKEALVPGNDPTSIMLLVIRARNSLLGLEQAESHAASWESQALAVSLRKDLSRAEGWDWRLMTIMAMQLQARSRRSWVDMLCYVCQWAAEDWHRVLPGVASLSAALYCSGKSTLSSRAYIVW